jgi:hypothetical protein
MFKTLPKRPTLIAVVVSLLGVSAMTIGMTVPAGAASSPAQNSIIIGGGSNTTYSMMTQHPAAGRGERLPAHLQLPGEPEPLQRRGHRGAGPGLG